MPSVRLSGNVKFVTKVQGLGAPALDEQGRLERTAEIPEEAYQRIEQAVAQGFIEGRIYLDRDRYIDWLLDR
ncbi:MAG TPA: hypothetical protein VIL46_14500 [Gemmataceae bacterium]